MIRPKDLAALAVFAWLFCHPGMASADGLLDGRVFTGMIGPEEKPDLPDSLHFDNGYFWSDICTRCGFEPGAYSAQTTREGIVFRGTLESSSRGRFDYEGLARTDGSLQVSIRWEKKRWYWTSSREIVFRGHDANQQRPLTLGQIRVKMSSMDPDNNPQCARF